MRKRVWLMNHYASHMLFNKGGRHYHFAKYLSRAGYEPVIFCANIMNNRTQERCIETEDLWTVKTAEEINTPFVYVRARKYLGNGKQRVLNMMDFYFNVQKAALQYAKQYGKPDVILASSVHPLTMIAGIRLAKKFGVRCVCEVRDLWPESIVVYSKRISRNSLPARIMYAGEKWIYKKADAVIFTQEGGPDYIFEQKWDLENGGPIDTAKLYHINNGVDLEAFDSNVLAFPYEDEDLDCPDTFKVVYAGSIRRVNNLGLIVDTAKRITDPKIRFIIYGNGDELESLRRRVQEENIPNIVFKGHVNKQYIPSIVSKADLNLAHWEMTPLMRLGDSSNKSFEYFAAGKPVFYTVRSNYNIAEKYRCGRLAEGYEPADLARGIKEMADLDEASKKEMAANARKAAEAYDFSNLTAKLTAILEQ